MGFLVISATFSLVFSGFWARLGSCFVDFSGFSYLFWRFFRLFHWVWGVVLWISAVSATFLEIFPAVSLGFGSCFVDFNGFSYFFPEFFQLLGWICGEGIGTKQKESKVIMMIFLLHRKKKLKNNLIMQRV